MSQRNPDKTKLPQPPQPPVIRRVPTTPAWLPAGLAIVGAIAGWGAIETRGLRKDLETVRAGMTDLGTKVEAVAKGAPQQQQRRGPDPNKVYTIKTEGAPTKGNPSAPIVIAEFSDFQ